MIKINPSRPMYRLTSKAMHVDGSLLTLIFFLITLGIIILYSASNLNLIMVIRQGGRLLFAFMVMMAFAFIPPHKYKLWSPWLYTIGLVLLIMVMLIGKIGKGAQRWLDLGIFRFQPSELMKIAVPMMVAWYFDHNAAPKRIKELLIPALIILIPGFLIAKQPDLGTAILVATSGFTILFIAGMPLYIISTSLIFISLMMPLLWHFLHGYQKQRILMLLNPESDPLGAGYHIIQSKIAIGSGGAFGKGWMIGSQSHLNFLPEHATDFIFAVCGEEFGFVGGFIVILFTFLIAFRSLKIATEAQTSFCRLLSAGLGMTFFISAFVNMGMVMGILPVVGIPLPLISYGGTAMVAFLASFGIIMSISSHRILFNTL